MTRPRRRGHRLLVVILAALLATTGLTQASAAPPAAAQATASSGGASWTFSGHGWGHGAGMSQYGAMEMARAGHTARQILSHYYTGTTYDVVPDTAQISVNLASRAVTSQLSGRRLATGGGTVTVTAGPTTMTGGPGARLTASAPAGSTNVTIACPTCTPTTEVTASTVAVSWNNAQTLLSVDGTSYKDGRVTVSRAPGTNSVNVVLHARIHDQYLDYIAEVPWGWPEEALRAQAAAARGYALSAHARGLQSECGCHVYNTVADQVFGGYPDPGTHALWARWQAAVRAADSRTDGYVVRYDGRIINALYHSSSGGRTQNGADVWGGSPVPYLRSVADPWSQTADNPRASWTTTVPAATVAAAFGLPDVARLDLSARNESGAVGRATATAADGSARSLTGQAFRMATGLNSAYLTRPASRHGGQDRYATAAAVAASMPVSSAIVIANGDSASPVDATLGGPLAGVLTAPILLTRTGTLPGPAVGELDRRGDSLRTAYILGGTGVVSPGVERALRDRGLEVVRLGGATRYETAQKVATEIARLGSGSGVVVAESGAMADVVSASGPAAALGYPILLTPAAALHPLAAQSIRELRPSAAFIAGGLITAGTEAQIDTAVSSVTRLSGADRYATAAAIARYFAPRISYNQVVISSGMDDNLVDSLSAGALRQPILFVRPTVVPGPTREAIQRMPAAGRVTAAGGTGAVSAAVVQVLQNA